MALVPDELRKVAELFPDRLALVVDGGGSMTFAEWERRSNAVARGLVELGVAPGERVALLLANHDALLYHIAYFATQKAGGVATPINPRLARREVAHILDNARPRVLVAAGDQLARARELAAGLDTPPVVVGPEVGAPYSWATMEANEDDAFQVPIATSDLADIVYTSGTTGLPKGVASTHDNVLHIPVTPSERDDAFLHAAPLATALGTYGAMIASLRLGLTNICLPSFDTTRFAQLISSHRPGWLMVVPAQVLLLREAGVLEGLDTSSVWMVLFSTAPMPPEATRWLAATFPPRQCSSTATASPRPGTRRASCRPAKPSTAQARWESRSRKPAFVWSTITGMASLPTMWASCLSGSEAVGASTSANPTAPLRRGKTAGCTPGTWGTSTPMDSSTSWTAKRT